MRTFDFTPEALADIRFELYAVLNEMRTMQNDHVSAWMQSPTGHSNECSFCANYQMKREGVKRAIRHFGGRPKPGW